MSGLANRSTNDGLWNAVNFLSKPKLPYEADAQLPSSPAIARIDLAGEMFFGGDMTELFAWIKASPGAAAAISAATIALCGVVFFSVQCFCDGSQVDLYLICDI